MNISPAPVKQISECELSRGLSRRVVVLCLTLAVVLGYALPVIDYKLKNTFLGATHLPAGAIGVLLVLVLIVNPLLCRLSKRLALSRGESLTVYISCLFSSLIPGHGAENLVIPVLLAPFYLATRENKWLTWLEPHLKPWLNPALDSHGTYNKAVVEGWFNGLRPGETIPWQAWALPLLVWTAAIIAIYVMLGCLSVMLRAQWAQREALAFPLLRLPLTMTEYQELSEAGGMKTSFWKNPLMWCGFGVASCIQLQRGLSLYFPDVPNFPLEMNLNALFSEAPWNQVGWIPISIFPIVVGVTYLLTSEVSFSLWFFFLFMKLQMMGAYYLGFMPSALPDAFNAFPGKMFQGYQTGGAYLAYVALVLWTGREHILHVMRRAFGRVPAAPGESDEALSYPVAFWGFILAFVYLVGFSLMAGVRLDIALVLWCGYLVFAIGLTRIAVEGGMLFLLHDIMPLGAVARLLSAGSSSWLTVESGLVPASFIQAGLIYHMRGFAMPSFVHAFKLAHDHKIPARSLLRLLALVCVISLGMSLFTVIHLGYDNGAMTLTNDWSHGHLALRPTTFIDSVVKERPMSTFANWMSLLTGSALTWGMMVARSRFAWFPFHPVGYLMCLTFSAHMFWFSIFLGWLAKSLLTRYGGVDTYRKLMPAFLGLVLGDVTMILFWLAIDGWQGRTNHLLMPG